MWACLVGVANVPEALWKKLEPMHMEKDSSYQMSPEVLETVEKGIPDGALGIPSHTAGEGTCIHT